VTPLTLIRRASRYSRAALTGDCGVFAFALAKLLGRSASLVFFLDADDLLEERETFSLSDLDFSEPNIRHVAVMWRRKLYDVEGEQTIEEIERRYFPADYRMLAAVFSATFKAVSVIRCNTDFSHDWVFYYHVMRRPHHSTLTRIRRGASAHRTSLRRQETPRRK